MVKIDKTEGSIDIGETTVEEVPSEYPKYMVGIGIYDETVPEYIAGTLIVDGVRKPVEKDRYLILDFPEEGTHTFDLEVPLGYEWDRWEIFDWLTGEKVDVSTARPYRLTVDKPYFIYAIVHPKAKIGPKAEIVRDPVWTGVMYKDEAYGPGTIPVKKGDTIYVYAAATNVGDERGPIWVRMVDRKSGRTLVSVCLTEDPGVGVLTETKPITVDSDMEIVAEAGHGEIIGQNKDDEWGC